MKNSSRGNFFSLPNEVFLLGLSAGELAVYSFLTRCENRKTHQCWPSCKTMGKRRPSGDGMVRKREDGRWEGRIVIGHKDSGEPIFRYVSAKTQKELLKKLHQNIEEYRDVDLCEDSKISLGEWLDRWLEEYAAPSVRASTLEGYRGYIQRNIKPHLGDKPVGKITTEDIRKLYRELQAHGRQEEHPQYGYRLAGSTIRRIHGVLHEALDAAVRENMIARNPTEGVTLPKKKAVPKQILNDAQLERFMKVIQEDKIWHDFFYTELTTGLRRGEICGLMCRSGPARSWAASWKTSW